MRPLCVLGVLAYLLLPVLHGWHEHPSDETGAVLGLCSTGTGEAAPVQTGHDGPATPDRHDHHDGKTCTICEVFSAVMGGGAVLEPPAVSLDPATPGAPVFIMASVAVRPVDLTARCSRGPPAITA